MSHAGGLEKGGGVVVWKHFFVGTTAALWNESPHLIIIYLIIIFLNYLQVCHRFRLTKRDDYFWVNFHLFLSEGHFLISLETYFHILIDWEYGDL